MSVQTWLNQALASIEREDGEQFAHSLSIWEKSSNTSLVSEISRRNDLLQLCTRILQDPHVGEIYCTHLKACVAVSTGDFPDAFQQYSSVIQSFNVLFEEDDASWTVPAFTVLNRDLRILAERADKSLVMGKKQPHCVNEAVDLFRQGLRLCLGDKRPIEFSKKRAALHIINHLLRVCFKVNNLQLCQGFTTSVDMPNFPDINRLPKSEQVTFRFFRGRLSLLNAEYQKAEEDLDFALEHCPRRSKKNKRLILLYLVPVKMLSGTFPTRDLLSKHKLEVYSQIAAVIKRGDVPGLEQCIQANQRFFLRRGLYLLLHKCKLIAYRNLFRSVHRIVGSNRLSIKSVETALKHIGSEMDSEEVQCTLATLIFSQMIKGYISHKSQLVVLSSKDPFPSFPIRSLYFS